MFMSTGILRYFDDPCKLIVEVDTEIVRYYRNFVPKCISLNKQMYAPHISVVRNEEPLLRDKWGAYEGKEIYFAYSNYIHCGNVYYWLDAYSQVLEDLRVELGLKSNSDTTRPPDHRNCFHITIGNIKEIGSKAKR